MGTSNEITARQVKKILEMFFQLGVTSEDLQEMFSSGLFPDLCRAAVQGTLSSREKFQELLYVSDKKFKFLVHYDETVSTILGHYDTSRLEANMFDPGEGKGSKEMSAKLILSNTKKTLNRMAGKEYLDRMGLRPATLKELLFFGLEYPDVIKRFDVVGLGSEPTIDMAKYLGRYVFPYVKSDFEGNLADFDKTLRNLKNRVRFLAFKKEA